MIPAELWKNPLKHIANQDQNEQNVLQFIAKHTNLNQANKKGKNEELRPESKWAEHIRVQSITYLG